MRHVRLLAVVVAVLAASAGTAFGERPPASLVPAEASTYVELNVDRLLGKAPETAALGQALARAASVEMMRAALAQEEEAAEVFDEIMGMVGAVSEAIGPRIGCAVWLPDLPVTSVEAGPKVLVVVEVRDAAKAGELVDFVVGIPEGSVSHVEPYAGAKVMMMGELALGLGEDWLALGIPAEMMRGAADRATGRVTGGSLWEDADYQRVLRDLPEDAVLTHYVSAGALGQVAGALREALPGAELPAPAEEGIGWAMGVRMEERDGRQIVTAYVTGDIEAAGRVAQTAQMAMLVPLLMQTGQKAQKAECLSNVRAITLAMQMYLADNNDRFPESGEWVAELWDYLRNEDVLKCPVEESEAQSSYAMNQALIGKSMVDVGDPMQLVVFYETANPGESPVGGPEDVLAEGRHEGGVIYGFADGHVEWWRAGHVPNFELE